MGLDRNVHNGSKNGGKAKGSTLCPLLLGAGAIVLAAVVAPTVSQAFSSGFDSRPVSLDARGGIGSFTPASVDPRLAATIKVTALKGQLFRFTPAGSLNRPDRSVTVAVRIDDSVARAVTVRGALGGLSAQPGTASFRIAPVAYNLGVARGYGSFAAGKPVTSPGFQKMEMPDLSTFTAAGPATPAGSARFAPRIALGEKDKAGRAPRTLEGQDDYQVDVGGSYRLTRNLKVIGGVRYSSDRDRIRPLTDGQQDSQAVYVGTQFRF